MNEYLQAAIQKLDREIQQFSGGEVQRVIYKPVAETLKSFCRQDAEFAQAVVQNNQTLSDCCKEITKDVNRNNAALSDIETYRRATNFYFPGAGIHMEMRIDLCASVSNTDNNKQSKVIRLELDDLLDF